jgi:fatty-acid desaturase
MIRLHPLSQKIGFNWSNFIWITSVHLIALAFAIPYFTWQAFVLFWIFYYLTGMFGITFSFHRLLTHKSFKAHKWLENVATFCGTLACQGGPLSWVGQHRLHHMHSDTDLDPHNARRGFWHSHIGYIFFRRQDLADSRICATYCKDIASNPYFWFLEKYMIPIQIVLALVFMGLGGLIGANFQGFDTHMATSFVVWGIFCRLTAVYNVTWLVNSFAHLWGNNPNKSHDLSKNNWIVGLLAFGEGWHNNHHAKPRSARHGWKTWQFDQTWILILVFKSLGLITNIQMPPQAASNLPLNPSDALEDHEEALPNLALSSQNS